jgi:ABC-2 type transport system permease protein
VRTFQLLVWLRWKLFLRSTTTGNRVLGAVFTVLLLVAFSPAWLGGAVAAWLGVHRTGVTVLPLVYGIAQLAWLSLGLLSGALGRSFDLDKFLRYPVRPRAVFGINVLASLLGPVPIMTIPSLVAVAIAAGQVAGPLAAIGASLAGAFVLLLTAALLQILLALLDEVLRRESTRFVASIAMTVVFVGLQFAARFAGRWVGEHAILKLANHEISGAQAVALAGAFLARLPTVGAPALLAGGAIEHSAGLAVLGLAACAGLLVLAVLPGAALMRHTVRGGEGASGGPRRHGRVGRGGFGFGGGLPHGLGLLLRYEVLTTLRHPQRLMSVLVAPLVGVVFFMTGQDRMHMSGAFVLVMLGTSVSNASLLTFSYDGPGVRSFYLMPVAGRELLLAKNLEQLLRLAVQFVLAFGALSFLSRSVWSPLLLTVLIADLAVVFGALAAGTAVSLRHPVRARRRGLTGRGGASWESTAVSLGVLVVGAALGAVVWGARRLAGPAWADPAGLVVSSFALAAGAAIWWRSLDLNARLFLECREGVIDAIARAEAD